MDPARTLTIDLETLNLDDLVDLRKNGLGRYALGAVPIVVTYKIGNGPVQCWSDAGRPLDGVNMPDDLAEAIEAGFMVAGFNVGFDIKIWNRHFHNHRIPLERTYDVKMQALANNLSGSLEGAASRLLGEGKQKDGKRLITKFCENRADPQQHWEDWQRFLSYAVRDTDLCFRIMVGCRMLSDDELAAYQVGEAINYAGIGIDVAFAEKAAAMAKVALEMINQNVARITGGAVKTINQRDKMIAWFRTKLDREAWALLCGKVPADATTELDEEGEEEEEDEYDGKPSIKKVRLKRLVTYLASLADPEQEDIDALAVARDRLEGAAMPHKFPAMLAQHVDGRIYHAFVMGGAGQTGRASSSGSIQAHNMTRASLGEHELTAINMLLDGCSHAALEALGNHESVMRKLSLLVRPTLLAKPGHLFVWCDWSNIEAREIADLSDSPGGRRRNAMFRRCDEDPSLPGLYEQSAAEMFGVDPREIDRKDPRRQAGKISELALGFGGGTFALQSMAVNYGITWGDAEAREIVDRWRAANSWALDFWGRHNASESYGLWGAAMRAMGEPDVPQTAGRITLLYLPEQRHTLFLLLPSGRPLCYPEMKFSKRPIKDDEGNVIDERWQWSFSRGYARIGLWHGILAENATQAAAADLLRGTLVRLAAPRFSWMPVVAHVHDEIIVEVPEDRAEEAAAALVKEMERGFKWTRSMPIKAKATIGEYYTKNEE